MNSCFTFSLSTRFYFARDDSRRTVQIHSNRNDFTLPVTTYSDSTSGETIRLCNAIIRGHPGRLTPGNPPGICTKTFTNFTYPGHIFFGEKSYQYPSPREQNLKGLPNCNVIYCINFNKSLTIIYTVSNNSQSTCFLHTARFCFIPCKSQNDVDNLNEHTLTSFGLCLLYRVIYQSPRPGSLIFKMAVMLQIPRVSPRVSCLGSARAVECPRPGPKIGDKSQQIPCYSPYVPGINPPGWSLISA